MFNHFDEDSLVIDSGRTGYYQRIVTESSIEASPKHYNNKLFTQVNNEGLSSRIETERTHFQLAKSKVKNTFVYFKPPSKSIYSVCAKQKYKCNSILLCQNNHNQSKQITESRAIKQPKFMKRNFKENLMYRQTPLKTQSDLRTPIKEKQKKFLDLTHSKSVRKGIQLSIEMTKDSLSRSTITDCSKKKLIKINNLGRFRQQQCPNIIQKF